MDWTQITITALTVIGSFLGVILTFFIKKISKKFDLDEGKQEILTEMAVSVQRVYDEEVRTAKINAHNGKLDGKQKDYYKAKAIEYTKNGLSKYALRLFNSFAKEKLLALVEKTVSKAKAK